MGRKIISCMLSLKGLWDIQMGAVQEETRFKFGDQEEVLSKDTNKQKRKFLA